MAADTPILEKAYGAIGQGGLDGVRGPGKDRQKGGNDYESHNTLRRPA